nr:transposase [Streptomyces sp. WAC07149]
MAWSGAEGAPPEAGSGPRSGQPAERSEPATSRNGGWRRQVIDAIAFRCRTGTAWMDLPERFGSWKGAHNRLGKWVAEGTWEKVFTALFAQADAEGVLDWVVVVDSMIVRAHQHVAGARRKGPGLGGRPTMFSDAPAAG